VHTGKPNNYLSSRRIAKIRSKRHADVIRDIRSVQPAYIQVYGTERNFALNEYKDSIGRKLPEYHLTKSQTIFLVSGYDMVLRACNILNEN
jgi:Rha family phage regulatory protein